MNKILLPNSVWRCNNEAP